MHKNSGDLTVVKEKERMLFNICSMYFIKNTIIKNYLDYKQLVANSVFCGEAISFFDEAAS